MLGSLLALSVSPLPSSDKRIALKGKEMIHSKEEELQGGKSPWDFRKKDHCASLRRKSVKSFPKKPPPSVSR
jgi:hypothetical protein